MFRQATSWTHFAPGTPLEVRRRTQFHQLCYEDLESAWQNFTTKVGCAPCPLARIVNVTANAAANVQVTQAAVDVSAGGYASDESVQRAADAVQEV